MPNLTLWDSPNGLALPGNVAEIDTLAQYVKRLTPREIKKVVHTFELDHYDMATEYTWNRTLSILREMVLGFGEDFVLEMLGRIDASIDTSELSEIDIINLAADLGFINKTAKIFFVQHSEVIRHFSSREADEEMDKASATSIIRSCIKYVLGKDKEDFQFAFNDFRNSLKQTIFKEDDEVFRLLINSPYFYKRTTVRTLLNLSRKTPVGGELQNVFTNMISIVPKLWDSLLSDDRWPIGFAYAKAVNEGNKDLVKTLKSVLLKVRGFDYVPENMRSNAFIEAANELLKVHFGFNNYYNEPNSIKHLLSLGTSIPAPAFGVCMTAALAVKIGNKWGHSAAAQHHVDLLLDNVSSDRWQYYLSQVLPGDETILIKLMQDSPIDYWIEIVQKYNLVDLEISNLKVSKLLNAANKGLSTKVKQLSDDILNELRR